MSTCIEFCGRPKMRNLRPEGKFQESKPEIPIAKTKKDHELQKQHQLNKLKYVQVRINDEVLDEPPREMDINFDM